MPCTSLNCTFSDFTKQIVRCGMCERIKHQTCADLIPRAIDIINKYPSIKWFCKDCLNINSGLCSAFKQTREMLLLTSKELAVIQERLSVYEKLFSSNNLLNMVVKNAVDAPPIHSNTPSCPLSSALPKDGDSLILLSPIPPMSPEVVIVEHPTLLQLPPKHKSKSAKSSSSSSSAKSRGAVPKSGKVTEVMSVNSKHTLPKNVNSSVNPCVDNGEVVISSHNVPTLKVVSNPFKSIFLSRLSEDTSEDDIFQYLSSKVSEIPRSECRIRKFRYSYKRYTSSFKIDISSRYFDTLLSANFWPIGVIVHKFESREKQRTDLVKLPNASSDNSAPSASSSPSAKNSSKN